ncbi:MAG: hypothetical protein EVA26_00305 [Burkholderiaceae bacterium]|nr:MAG: hypothetical protein EVA26_00305 [Burkholderiaceae bacterium]
MPRIRKSSKSQSKSEKKKKLGPQPTNLKKKPEKQIQNLTGAEFTQKFDQLCNSGKTDEAQTLLDSLIKIEKWQRLNFQSIIEYKRGELVKAEALMREAAREPKSKHGVKKNLAGMLVLQGRMREALPFAESAYEADKKDLKTLHVLINCFLDLGMTKRALDVVADGLKDHPEDKMLLVSRASALRSELRNDESLVEINNLVEKFPNEPVIHRIKADLLGDRNTLEALPFYETALELSVKEKGREDPAIMWNMSLHLLRARNLKRGWECWEQGFHPIVGTMGRNLPKRINDMNRADKEGMIIDKDRWTIVCSEQGIGDQVLFLHSMNEAIDEMGKILYIVEKRMHSIIKRSFPKLVVACPGVTYDWTRSNIKKNGYIPLGSLPRRHRNNIEDYYRNRKPFLIANRKMYDQFKTELQKQAAGRPIIGISWKGGFWQIQRKTKELEIEKWLPIFSKDALFVNLQYGDVKKDIEMINDKGYKLLNFPKFDFKIHLDEWLAIASACDGIISVSTALVHFAGAVGQKIAVVMPGKQGPWHLGIDDKESMAYKNVRIFRKQGDETIEDVVKRVADLIIT